MNLWGVYGWEDDLVMTGVRSFDIKAYDNALAAYADLGWGDDPRQTGLLSPQFMNTGQTASLPGRQLGRHYEWLQRTGIRQYQRRHL